MLDRRDSDDVSMQGIILLNRYSDDGLASIDNSKLWNKFMLSLRKLLLQMEDFAPLHCAIVH